MKAYIVGEQIDLNTAASATAIETIGLDNPFQPSAGVVAALSVEAPVGTALRLEGSDDGGSTWSTLAEVLAADGAGTFFSNITLTEQIRTTVVGAAGAGVTGQVYLLGH